MLETVFEANGLKTISLNNRIITAFYTRLYRMVKSISVAAQKGSRTLNALLLKWKSDPEAKCQIKIYYNELEVLSLKNENDKLIKRKRKLETELEAETAKRKKTEKALSDQDKLTKKAKIHLKDIVKKRITKSKARGPSTKNYFTDYSKKNKRRECTPDLLKMGLLHYHFLKGMGSSQQR